MDIGFDFSSVIKLMKELMKAKPNSSIYTADIAETYNAVKSILFPVKSSKFRFISDGTQGGIKSATLFEKLLGYSFLIFSKVVFLIEI